MDCYPKVRLEAGTLHVANCLIHVRGLFLIAKVQLFLESARGMNNSSFLNLRASSKASAFFRNLSHFHVVTDKEIERRLELLPLQEGKIHMIGRRPDAQGFCGLDLGDAVHLLTEFGRAPTLPEILFAK